jgi:hypothetical protein
MMVTFVILPNVCNPVKMEESVHPQILAPVQWGGLMPIVRPQYVSKLVGMEGIARRQIFVLVRQSGWGMIAGLLFANKNAIMEVCVLLLTPASALQIGAVLIVLNPCVIKDILNHYQNVGPGSSIDLVI